MSGGTRGDAPYSEGDTNYCKSSPASGRRESQRGKILLKLYRGMEGETCIFVTFRIRSHQSTASGIDSALRQIVWHNLFTRIRQRWPQSEYITVYEHEPHVGVHLHAVLKRVPGLSGDWIKRIVARIADDVSVHVEDVYSPRLAAYLGKQIADPVIASGWPKHFRVATNSRGWCEWLNETEWRAQRRKGGTA